MPELTKNESSLLLYLESRAVEVFGEDALEEHAAKLRAEGKL
jgi:hypothetical protein